MTRSADEYRSYKTVLSPDLFAIPWEPFYREGVRRTEALKARYRVTSDIPYGDGKGQILDLYLPKTVTADTPTLVFLHGGAFREGHPGQYGFVGEPYLERGVAFVSASYRQAPEAFYPDHADDMATLAGWLHAHLADHGLDPTKVAFSGHSSGTLMIALAAVRTDWQAAAGVPTDYLDRLALAGANYHHLEDTPTNLVRDPSRREEGTVTSNLTRVPAQALIIFSENEINTGDGRRFGQSGRALAEALQERGSQVSVFALEGTHQDTCAALCDTQGAVFAAVMDLLRF